ncbi:MICOS complex subunit MIC13-like [Liolophura sinensis]|uniref:MICOS complex subunit MIC13-like n=1 Tax=Liolophura sinensis TaxID=3198878 RepID=UPI0031580D17
MHYISNRKMASALLKTAAKVAIGIGAVYVTVDQGVWRDSSMGTRALNKVRNSVLPTTNEYINSVPSLAEVNISVLDKWNTGVKKVFGFLAETPSTVSSYSRQAVDSTANFLRDVNKS